MMDQIVVEEYNELTAPASGLLSLPNFHVNERQVKEITGWNVGGKYTLKIVVEQKSASKADDGQISAGFDILAYEVLKEESDITEEEIAQGLSGQSL